MKKLILLLMLIIITTAAFAVSFDPYWFKSRTIIGCFTTDAIPELEGKLDFTIKDGFVHTGISSIDAITKEFKVVDLIQAHPYVKKPEWNDKGVYLQKIYRFILDSDERIDEAVKALEKDPYLHFAELEAINRQKFVPNDPMLSQQYTHSLLQSFDAWDYVTGSHDVVVAITDSGVKWNHPDLMGNIWINPEESPGMSINWQYGTITGGNGQDAGEGGNKIDDLVGWDFFDSDNNPIQNWSANDHGTHVAGCAAAVGNNGIGVVGTAPNVSILSCKGAPSNENSDGVSYGYDQIKYSAEVGAHVINASWGGPGSGAYPNSIVNYVTALGAAVISAAGNENTEHSSNYQDYPADCLNALNVAATNNTDVKASFSDYGSPIDISAPGATILSTIISGSGYASYNGTSMASPVVAGVAALVKSLHPEYSSEDLRFRLMATADPIDDINPNYVGKLGTGRVNAFTATMYDKIPNIVNEGVTVTEAEGDGDNIANPGETIFINVQLRNAMTGLGIFWKEAQNLTARLRTNYPGITIIDSVSTFGPNGTLSAETSSWNNTPFKISAIADLPSETIPFEIYITSNDNDEYPYHKTIPFTIEIPLYQSGWPIYAGGSASSSAIFVDLDADNHKEIIFGDLDGNIHVANSNGEDSIAGFPLNLGSATLGSIAMSSQQNDGSYLFATTLSNHYIAAFDSNGEILFNQAAGSPIRSGALVAKLFSDEEEKIVFNTQNGSLHVYNFDGTSVPNFPLTLAGSGLYLAQPSVADLNGDGNMEIITIALNGYLNAIDPSTGTNISGFPISNSLYASMNTVTVANVDSDSYPELLLTTSNSGYLYGLNHDGSVLFQKNLGGAIRTSPVIADVNNDGSKEIIVIKYNGAIHIMHSDGTDFPNMPISIQASVECTPVVARYDYNSDMASIIFGDSNGYLHSIRMDGTESPNFPIKLNGNLKVSPAISDLDLDGDMDIAIPDNANYYVLDIKRDINDLEWICYLANFGRTNNVHDATSNAVNVTELVATTLFGAYPNPFNPSTTLSFNLQESSPVSLEIYNQKGQKVRSLISETLPAGKHQIIWNGTDDNGNGIASGIYLYRMKSGKYSSTRKMILMK